MSQKRETKRTEDTPQDMMKRIFTIAELILRSAEFQQIPSVPVGNDQNHKSEDMQYGKDQYESLGRQDGTEEK